MHLWKFVERRGGQDPGRPLPRAHAIRLKVGKEGLESTLEERKRKFFGLNHRDQGRLPGLLPLSKSLRGLQQAVGERRQALGLT